MTYPTFTPVRPRRPFTRDGPLEPLDVPGLRPPFVDPPTTPSLVLGDGTPSSVAMTLSTPDLDPVYLTDDRARCPPAPLLKDMDSFTEGTAQGSFDYSLESSSSCSDQYTSGSRLFPDSVAFSPEHPTRSIELWRDDVLNSTDVDNTHPHPQTVTPEHPHTPLDASFDPHTPTAPGVQDHSIIAQPRPRTLKRQLSSAFENYYPEVAFPSFVRDGNALFQHPTMAHSRYMPRRRERSPSDSFMLERPSSAPPLI